MIRIHDWKVSMVMEGDGMDELENLYRILCLTWHHPGDFLQLEHNLSPVNNLGINLYLNFSCYSEVSFDALILIYEEANYETNNSA